MWSINPACLMTGWLMLNIVLLSSAVFKYIESSELSAEATHNTPQHSLLNGYRFKKVPNKDDVIIKQGEDQTLCCELCDDNWGCFGHVFSWKKKGSSNVIETGSDLKLKDFNKEMEGTYICYYYGYEGTFTVQLANYWLKKVPDKEKVIVKEEEDQTLCCELCDPWDCFHKRTWWKKTGSNVTIERRSKLELEDFNGNKEGTYICYIDDNGFVYEGTFTALLTNYRIKKVPDQDTIIVEDGEELTLRCELCDYERCYEDTFEWKREGSSGVIKRGKKFELKDFNDKKEGKYICIHEYRYKDSFMVLLARKPEGTPTISPLDPVFRVMDSFLLTCNTSGIHRGTPEGNKYYWYRNGEKIEGQNDETFYHTPEEVKFGEIYGCALKNEYDSSSIGTISLTVEAPPVIEYKPDFNQTHRPLYNDKEFHVPYIISGSQLTNFGIMNINQSTQYRYFKMKNETIPGTFSYGQKEAQLVTLSWILDSINLKSCKDVTFFNGTYIFMVNGSAANIPTSEESTFTIDVQYPGIWNGGLLNESSPQCKHIILHCDVCAEPAPTNYSWSFMGEELVNATGEKLHFYNISSKDYTSYTCTVINRINEVEHRSSFNFTLEEDGNPHSPSNFAVISRTSRTLMVAWNALVKECYELDYELQIRNDTNMTEVVTYRECKVEGKCRFRITDLQPQTRYRIDIRAKTGEETNMFYSDYVQDKGITAATPIFEYMKPEVTETYIRVRWSYETEAETVPMEVTTEDMTVAIYYKKSADCEFKRHPENGSIPAQAGWTDIEGSFDTSATYLIKYEVYEGDQLAIDKGTDEITPTETSVPVDGVVIILLIFGAVIGICVISLLVGFWCHKQKRTKADSPTAGLRQDEGLDYETLGSTGAVGDEYTELKHISVLTDVSCDETPTELAPQPNYETLNRTGRDEAQYMDLKDKSVLSDVSYNDVPIEPAPLPPNNEKLTGGAYDNAQYMDLKDESDDDCEHSYEYIKSPPKQPAVHLN